MTVETIHGGIRAGSARVGTGKRVHLVAQGWLDSAQRTSYMLEVVAACGARGRVAELVSVVGMGDVLCPSCMDVTP